MDFFKNPQILLVMAAFAVLMAFFLYWAKARRERILASLGLPKTLLRLFPLDSLARKRRRLALTLAALALGFLSLAGPQWGIELVPGKSRARQIVIAVDASLSMSAEDLQPSRMERAKAEMAYLLESLKGDRVGLIAFAGRAQIQCPLTTDRSAAKMFLRALRPDMLPDPGTDVGDAVELGAKMLAPYPGEKALILLTDGEDFGGKMDEAAAPAKEAGVRVFALAVGRPEGAPIPIRDASGNLEGYKKDRGGTTVITRPDYKGLEALAAMTGGESLRLETGAADELVRRLANLTKSDSPAAARGRFRNRYQWPLSLACLALMMGWLWPEPRRSKKSPALPAKALAAAALLLLFSSSARAESVRSLLREGKSLYDRQDYQGAYQKYQEAAAKDPKNPAASIGQGAALYQLGKYDDAAAAFQAAAQAPGQRRPDALYDLGSTQYQKGRYREAADSFVQALRLQPNSEDARHNLALSLLHLKQPPPKNQQQQQKKQDKDQDKKQQNRDQKPNQGAPKPNKSSSGGMSEEDAKRVLQAVKEKENSPTKAQREMMEKTKKKPAERANVEHDW